MKNIAMAALRAASFGVTLGSPKSDAKVATMAASIERQAAQPKSPMIRILGRGSKSIMKMAMIPTAVPTVKKAAE